MPNRKAKQRKMDRKKRREAIKIWIRKRKEEKKQKRILENTSKRNMGRLDG